MKSRAPGLDRALLAHAHMRWQKVARILFEVMDKCFPNRFGRPQLIGSRIQALARAGAIEGRGIFFKNRRAPPSAIRFSEMRLPPRGRRLRKRRD